jgi:hypothetical protein
MMITCSRSAVSHEERADKGRGHKLTITVDLSKEFGPSASGKTIIIASTEGSVPVFDREEKVGLNVYRKK